MLRIIEFIILVVLALLCGVTALAFAAALLGVCCIVAAMLAVHIFFTRHEHST